MRILAALAASLLCLAAHAASAQTAREPETLAYGPAPAQRMDIYRPARAAPAPLLVFIHGGAWRLGDKREGLGAKARWFTAQGYVVASLDYRLVPDASVADQAMDVAAAIARLRADQARLGIDPGRILLMGHSSGAHLAALVATDPRFLDEAGVPLEAIRAVSLLDTAAYDVPAQIAQAGPGLRYLYRTAFGTDAAAQWQLSPKAHAGAPNGGAFLIHCLASRADSCPQAEGFAQALRQAGTGARVVPVSGSTHRRLNQEIGNPGDGPTQAITAFFRERLRQPSAPRP